MGWVSFLRAVETASGAADLGSNLNERSASFAVLLSALRDSNSTPGVPERLDSSRGIAQTPALAVIAASSFTVGSRVIPSRRSIAPSACLPESYAAVPASNLSPTLPKARTS